MKLIKLVSVFFAAILANTAASAEVNTLGYGRLINNDYFGDNRDRGHTGSYSSSRIMGKTWNGILPSDPFNLVEFRFHTSIIAPDKLHRLEADDRPYATTIGLGLHTHYQSHGLEIAMGADAYIIGPQTRLHQFQIAVHNEIGAAPPSDEVLAQQIKNQVRPNIVVEMGKPVDLAPNIQFRPFVEGRYGVENIIRVGFDTTLGTGADGALMVREPETGQRYHGIRNKNLGWSYVIGADIARVGESVYLPASSGIDIEHSRKRARLGVHWQGKKNAYFYGVTWLSKEFKTQSYEQLVGSLRMQIDF